MALRLALLRSHPTVFHRLTGMEAEAFDALAADLAPTLGLTRRPRAAGRPFHLGAADQLLMAAVWLRHHPTQEALGALFGVSDSTALRAVARCLPALRPADCPRVRARGARAGGGKPLAAVLDAVPGLEDLIRGPGIARAG
jgi:hypothetical protein